jgi:cellulose synthase/poly-beta-1,6-N-acetylglucosamine synthase-like glycosyltransferase
MHRRVSTPQISIVIPAYVSTPRQAELLDETLATVDRQDHDHYEVIVVDDGSPLPVADIVASHRCATVISRKNGGSAVARNTGIAASRGEALVFLDADDHLLPHALTTGWAQLSLHRECGFVVGPHDEMSFEGGPVPWGVAAPAPTSNLYHTLLAFDWYIIPPSSAMFRRAAVMGVDGFRDPWGADDLDFYLRVAHGFGGHCYSGAPVTRYRRYSTSSSRDGERMLQSIRVVYERQWPLVKGDPEAEAAYQRGLTQLTGIFKDCLIENVVDRVRARQWRRGLRSARLLMSESPVRLGNALGRLMKVA